MVDKITDIKLRILSWYRSDYGKGYHVRELATLLGKSHVTLLPHLKGLEEDDILIPKKSGKNKVYFLNLENLVAKKYLILVEHATSMFYLQEVFLIKKITEELAKLDLGGTFLLFGSYAKRSFKEDSDVDLFYVGDINSSEIQKVKNIGKIYGKTLHFQKSTMKNFNTSLRTLYPFINEIMNHHILLQNPEPFIQALWNYYNEIKR